MFGILAALVVCASAHADLKELIQEHKNDSAVIVPVAQSPDNDYGLLIMPPADFAQQVGLLAPGKLENDHFKLVQDETEEVLNQNDFDADNVIYHLTQARTYYAKLAAKSGQADPALDHKVTVRVRVDHAYNLVTHFAQRLDFNNSRYIPKNYAGKWGQEVWFDSPKGQFFNMDWYSIAVAGGMAIATKAWESAAITTPLQVYEHYNAGIDAAKMPNVIYHEAFHYATDADGLFPMASEGNPVAEDYANYFGSSIIGRPEIADIDEFSSRFYKHKYDKIKEIKDTAPATYNATGFGPSLFWQIRKWLGQERADQLVWNSLQYLNGAFLHTAVPKAISAAAHADEDLSAQEIQQIDDLLTKYAKSFENLQKKFNPGSVIDLDATVIQDQGVKQANDLRAVPAQLQEYGVDLTPEEQAQINATADQWEQQARQPNFKDKVIGALKKVGHILKRAGIDTGKAVGYTGSAIYSATEAPLNFGTDFATGLILGHGLISEGEQTLLADLIGAGGGVPAVYYTYAGLGAIGFSAASPATSSAMGVVLVDSLVCMKANQNPQSQTELARYCRENNKIMQLITQKTAKGGAKVGDFIHREIIKITDYIKKL